ncbi:MAG: UbiA family prenyltransferase, partial [Sphingomonadales bacterium]|nr:UbiA family prenyltransferase [Sphingomonadales bacterium]
MLTVLRQSWPLLLGIMLLMVGNGMQGTLLGIRGDIEGIGTYEMSIVMSAYFAGFLFGSQWTPVMIRRVGHVRVFAALGSLISAVLILYAAVPHWIAWTLMRVVIGLSFSGVYITAESWLNASSTNDTRGQALSAYMIVQMIGIITGQALMNTADPAGYLLFVIPSVLVSLAFTPILLSVAPAPTFAEVRRLPFKKLFHASPLGVVGMFLMGGTFSAIFGMAAVGGSYYLQALTFGWTPLLAGCALGLPAAAVLLVNNYRDLETDVAAGRRTLCHYLGRPRARVFYALLLLTPIPLALGQRGAAWPLLLALPPAIILSARLFRGALAECHQQRD